MDRISTYRLDPRKGSSKKFLHLAIISAALGDSLRVWSGSMYEWMEKTMQLETGSLKMVWYSVLRASSSAGRSRWFAENRGAICQIVWIKRQPKYTFNAASFSSWSSEVIRLLSTSFPASSPVIAASKGEIPSRGVMIQLALQKAFSPFRVLK